MRNIRRLIEHLKDNRPLFLLLWLAALLTFAVAKAPGGMDVDSYIYGVTAKEVARSNQWLRLYDPSMPGYFYGHFPLLIWITALIFKLFGVSSFTAKLFPMSCLLGLVAAVYYFGALLKNRWLGFLAAICLLFTNHIIRLSMQCRMDIPLTLFITLALLSFYLARRYSRRYYILFGAFTALAIMVKDAAGLAPLAVVFIYLAARMKFREFFNPFFILGLVFAFGPVLFWAWLDRGALLKDWYYHNFLHLYGSSAYKEPWYYYLRVLGTKYVYFLPFAVYGAYLAVKEARRQGKPEFYLLIIWAVLFPLAFSFARQKLHYLLLPMYPATALLAGLAFERMIRGRAMIKAAAALKYILFAWSAAVLFLPLNFSSRRFEAAVRMSPAIDRILEKLPDYDFIAMRDSGPLLFHSRVLTRVHPAKDNLTVVDAAMSLPQPKTLAVFMSEKDFGGLSDAAREGCRLLIKHKDRVFLVKPAHRKLVVELP